MSERKRNEYVNHEFVGQELRGRDRNRKSWPRDCVWPEPIWDGFGGYDWDEDVIDYFTVDEDARELLDIKEYFDDLVKEGLLNEDYTVNEEYFLEMEDEGSKDTDDICIEDDLMDEDFTDEEFDPYDWKPEKGTDYWDDGFDLDSWQEDLNYHMNLLKISACDYEHDPIIRIREITGYQFINENLLRQAFTRRAFQVEYGLTGCAEELEFLGDMVLNTVVTREIVDTLTWTNDTDTAAPFMMKRKNYREGDLSKLRARFISGEYLAERARTLGLGEWILYGTGEQETGRSLEDALEALVGAVAIDCGWKWEVLEDVVDKVLCLQLSNPDDYLKKPYYDVFNAWHQKHFGRMPEYEVYDSRYRKGAIGPYECDIRFFLPENDKGVDTTQWQRGWGDTRSKARELAAEFAYRFVCLKGLWINLKDSGISPDLDKSINQLQELYQKKYIEKPIYEFTEESGDFWFCVCRCNDVSGHGRAGSKTAAKKEAAYMVLERLFEGK